MNKQIVRIASRGSQLALWQAHSIQDALLAADPGLQVEIEIVRTTGDKILDVPLARIGDRGLFTKEIDDALLQGRADLAVHSLKDVPTRLPEGLVLAAVTQREDPRDVLILPEGRTGGLADLPAGARVGTSSLRRRSQLRALRPDLEVLDLRGNLNTRLAKLDAGEYDGILLAAAGVLRLGWEERISEYLEPVQWLPAVGQGALAVMTRADDQALLDRLRILHDASTAAIVTAERAFLHGLEGGCQVPIGALGRLEGDELVLEGLLSDLNGRTVLREERRGRLEQAAELGRDLAQELLGQGGDTILEEVRRESDGPPVPAP